MQPQPQPKSETSEEAAPVAQPMPPKDGPKPIPAGADEVEKFLVATDTEGGD